MSKYAIPHPEFLAWVATVLNTTQVSLNVVLLALLFVHRLKKLNPAVQGRPGSQYRLFTVALMLGNKCMHLEFSFHSQSQIITRYFTSDHRLTANKNDVIDLDDNTYTNKTWADVSGISVQEIHIMEVEFLSNMRYSLYVPESEWSSWPERLRRFHAYWDHARKLPLSNTPPQNANRTLPLQTAASRTLPPSPPYTCDLQIPMPLPPVEINPQMITTTNELENSRKRSLDQSAMQPPPPQKRMARLPLSVAVPQYQNNYPTCFTKPASDQPFYNIIPGGPGGPGYDGSASQQQQQQQTAYHPTPFPHSLTTPQQQQRPENYLPAPIPNPLSNLLPPPTGMVQQPYHCLPPIVRFETALQTQQMIMERGIQQQQPQVLPQQQTAPQEQQQYQPPQLPLPHNRALSCASSFTSPISNSPGSGVAFNNSPFNIHQPRSPYSAHHSLANSPLTPGGAGSFNNGGLSTVPSFGGFTGGLPTPVTMGREMAGRDYHTRASSAALGFLDGLSQMSQAQISQMKQSAKEFRDRALQLEEESETRLKRDREIWQVGREREEREKEQAQIREIWQAGRTREEREKVQEQIRKQNTALLNQYSRTTSIDMQDFLGKMEPQHQQPQQSRHQQQQFGLTRLPIFPEIPSASSNSTLNSSFHLDNPGTLGTPGTTGTQSNPVNLDSSNSLPELPPCPPSFQTRLYHLPTPGEPTVSTYGLPTPAPATATSNYVPATSTYNVPATLATSSENSRSHSPVRILTMQIDAGLAGLARKNHQLPPVNHVEGYGKDAFALRHG